MKRYSSVEILHIQKFWIFQLKKLAHLKIGIHEVTGSKLQKAGAVTLYIKHLLLSLFTKNDPAITQQNADYTYIRQDVQQIHEC